MYISNTSNPTYKSLKSVICRLKNVMLHAVVTSTYYGKIFSYRYIKKHWIVSTDVKPTVSFKHAKFRSWFVKNTCWVRWGNACMFEKYLHISNTILTKTEKHLTYRKYKIGNWNPSESYRNRRKKCTFNIIKKSFDFHLRTVANIGVLRAKSKNTFCTHNCRLQPSFK